MSAAIPSSRRSRPNSNWSAAYGLAARTPATHPKPATHPEPAARPERTRPPKRLSHLGPYVAAQVVLAFLDLSWIRHLFTDDALQVLNGTNRDFGGLARLTYGVTKVWAVILVVTILWTL